MSNAQALVEQALAEGRLDDLAASLDAAELQAPFAAGDPLLPPWPAAAHLLAHAGNISSTSDGTALDDARFLWRRLPQASREQPAAAAAFALLRALWLPDPVAAWSVLRSSFGVGAGGSAGGSVGGSGGGGATVAVSGDPALAALAARVAAGLRSRVAAVLPRAYSRLPLPRAAALLGFVAEEEEGGEGAAAALEALVAGQAGWAVSGDGTALSLPRPVAAAAAAAGVGVAPSAASAASAAAAAAALADSEDELAKLSKYVLQLEAGA